MTSTFGRPQAGELREPRRDRVERDAGTRDRTRSEPLHVLVVDDEPAARRAFARAFMARGLVVDTAESGAAALDLVRSRKIDAVLLDRDLPEMDGLALLAQLKQRYPDVEVVVMASIDDEEAAAAAAQASAYAILAKPLPSPEAAVPPTERAAERRRLVERARALEQQLAEHEQLGDIVGSSSKMVDLLRRADNAAPSSAHVLLLGERGTGKELVARAVHRRSSRAREALVVLCPRELDEHAATAELAAALSRADGGTLLVDDVGALPRAAQAELARALASPDNDTRVLATALPEVREQMARGDFREDLFYRLAAILLEVPPLRRRREDVPLLAYHFLSRCAAREGKEIRRIGVEALRRLREHEWPGNVGELRGAIQHAVVMARGDSIVPADLPLGRNDDDIEDTRGALIVRADALELPYADAKERAVTAFDREYVERLMKRAKENVSEAARLAGMDRSNFRRLLKKVRGRDEDLW